MLKLAVLPLLLLLGACSTQGPGGTKYNEHVLCIGNSFSADNVWTVGGSYGWLNVYFKDGRHAMIQPGAGCVVSWKD